MGLNPQVRAIGQSEGGGGHAGRRPSPVVVSCWAAAERRRRTAEGEERQGVCGWVSGPLLRRSRPRGRARRGWVGTDRQAADWAWRGAMGVARAAVRVAVSV